MLRAVKNIQNVFRGDWNLQKRLVLENDSHLLYIQIDDLLINVMLKLPLCLINCHAIRFIVKCH
jgi:hypothetical protein